MATGAQPEQRDGTPTNRMPEVERPLVGVPEAPAPREREPVRESEAEQLERQILERMRQAEQREVPTPTAPPPVTAPAQRAIDPVQREIEDILAEDLGAMYRTLPPAQQATLKREGERSAAAIRTLLGQVTVKARSILTIIVRWLKLIPGVNRFFLEQEAKIKTDKVMALHTRVQPRR